MSRRDRGVGRWLALAARKARTAGRMLRDQGLGAVARQAAGSLGAPTTWRDPVAELGFLDLSPFGPEPEAAEPGTLTWFFPAVVVGSGGILNLTRFMRLLEGWGWRHRIVVVPPHEHRSPARLRAMIREHFFPLEAEVYLDLEAAPPSQVGIATSWPTAYYLQAWRGARRRAYFVQDYEPAFFPWGSHASFAAATYGFGFHGFTAGSWIAEKLANEHGMATTALGFAYDRELYVPTPRAEPTGRILFYARPPTPRRGFELGVLTLRALKARMPEARVAIAGWDVLEYDLGFECENLGTLPLAELPGLYARCDAALVLSHTNASLLPLELAGSEVAIVSNDDPCNTWLLPEGVAALARPQVEPLAAACERVLRDHAYRATLVAAARAYADGFTWEGHARVLDQGLRSLGDVAAPSA